MRARTTFGSSSCGQRVTGTVPRTRPGETWRYGLSVDGSTAGDVVRGAGGEGALVAREPADQGCHLLGSAHATDRDALDHVVDVFRRQSVEDRRLDHRGRDAVD